MLYVVIAYDILTAFRPYYFFSYIAFFLSSSSLNFLLKEYTLHSNNMPSNDLTPRRVLDIIAQCDEQKRPFLEVDFANQRSSKKSTNKYMTVYILDNGKRRKFRMSWKFVELAGGIKKKEERKYGVSILFRRSSGDLGEAVYRVYTELEKIVKQALQDGTVKVKKDKQMFRNIIQTELEDGTVLDDPMIRLKLPFKMDTSKQDFRLVKVELKNGKPAPVNVYCDEEDVHEKIRSRMVTSGHVNMDTMVFSGFGISVPAKVQLLMIKPVANDAPEPEELMSQSELAEMIGEDVIAEPEQEKKEEEPELSPEEQLAALADMAAS